MRRGSGRLLAVVAVAAVLGTPVGAAAKEGSLFKEAVRSKGGVVAADHLAAAKAGIAILDRGGNAMDAAVATVFAMGVARPELCGIGGGGFLVYRSADGEVASLDFREMAPAAYTYTPGLSIGGHTGPFGLISWFGTGHGTVGVPGTVAGMAAATERYGTLPLADLVEPARVLAADGVRVTTGLSEFMKRSLHRLRLYEDSARIYLKNGNLPYSAGDTLRQPEYADSLALIQSEGPEAFYEGPIAKQIAASMAASGTYPGDKGTMTEADLARYEAIWREPLQGTYRGHEIVTMGAPTSGGLFLLETLNLLEGFDLRTAGRSSADAVHLTAEAQKIAWADRNAYVGDPAFTAVPVARMTSKDYAAQRRGEIGQTAKAEYEPGAGTRSAPAAVAASDAGGHTSHVSVTDGDGNSVAVTCTIEQVFGSAVVAPGTGFLLNNELTDFDPVEGHANAPKPLKRPRSSMTPAIVVRDGKSLMAVGGAGGSSIPMGVLSAVLGLIDYGEDLARAVDAERSDARGWGASGRMLALEAPRFDAGVIKALEARGHEIVKRGEYQHAVLNATGSAPRGGEHLASSDQRNNSYSGADADQAAALGQDTSKPGNRRGQDTSEPGNPRGQDTSRPGDPRGNGGNRKAAPARLQVLVRPRTARPGRVRLRVTVLRVGRPVRGALVRVGRSSGRTGHRGVAIVRPRLRAGRHRVLVRSAGSRPTHAVVRVRR